MRSILGRVPGAEKHSQKPNHSAPQQPHPDDALRPVRPPQELLKQRGGWQDFPHPPLWEGQNATHSGEGAWSGETFAGVKSLSTPTTPPGRRRSARPTSPKAAKAAGRLQDFPHPPLREGQNAKHSGEGAWSGETFARVKSLSTPTTPPGRRHSARPTSPRAAKAAGRLQDFPHPPLWEGQKAPHSGEGAWSGETFAGVKSLSTPTTPPGRGRSARPTSPKAAKAAGRLQSPRGESPVRRVNRFATTADEWGGAVCRFLADAAAA
jgi:hypothetical protein